MKEEQQQPAAAQAEPHAAISTPEQESGGDQARPPRAQEGRRAAVIKAAKKRRASEPDHESGGELESGRKTKVYVFLTCTYSLLLMYDVFYRELSATVPDSAVCYVYSNLVSERILPRYFLDQRGSILVFLCFRSIFEV